MLEVLDQEKGLALAETLTETGERIAAGESISGPAADRYRAAAAEFSDRYAGTYLGKGELRALVDNPRLQVYEDPKAFLTCNHDAFTALCAPDRVQARDGGRGTPDHSRCQSACPNISRTDSQITALRAEIVRIDDAAEAGFDPYPIAAREQQVEDAGGSVTPGPPVLTQSAMSAVASRSLTRPSQTGRPPALRPVVAGWTTTTLARSQASRQSVTRTVAVPPKASHRSRSWAAWSRPGTFGVPQQQPRHTVTVGRPGARRGSRAAGAFAHAAPPRTGFFQAASRSRRRPLRPTMTVEPSCPATPSGSGRVAMRSQATRAVMKTPAMTRF